MADISANLCDGDLSVADVARRHHVTPRHIHKLFENEGFTFSSFVLGQRLSRAHRILSDPRLADRNISSVAFDVGFGDLSYFNRTFRRRYAGTPTEIRQSAMRPDALLAPSLFRQNKRISTQDYRDGRKDNSRCKLRDLFYFWCGLLLAWRRCRRRLLGWLRR
jgi:AraC-like DNA-binding protein